MCVCMCGVGGIRGITRLSLWQLSRVSECTFIKFHLNGALVTYTIVKTLKTEITVVRKPICDIVFCAMTFWFRCFNFLLSYFDFLVLCSVDDVVVLNGTIHEVETRYRQNDGRKRSCKYFNAVIVHIMLVGFFCIWNPCSWFYHKVKMYRACYKVGSLSVKAFK